METYVVKVYTDKTVWYQNGLLHRVDGPAIEFANGDKFWYQGDLLHRVDGPAVEWANGGKEWYQGDLCHRVDGPAVEWVNGGKEWYLEGTRYTEEEFRKKVNSSTCSTDGKVVEIEGKKYKMVEVD